MNIAKFGVATAFIAGSFSSIGLANAAPAGFVETVKSEAECLKQEGTLVTVKGAKHCLVPVIPAKFQDEKYAGELKGVTTCKKEDTRKTQIGDFCVIALEKIKVKTKPVKTKKGK